MGDTFPSNVISHWSELFEGLEESSLRFYESVEAALQSRHIPNIETSRAFLETSEG